MKKFPQKATLAAIILSCGFVTHADPTARNSQIIRTKVATEHAWHVLRATETPTQPAGMLASSDILGSR